MKRALLFLTLVTACPAVLCSGHAGAAVNSGSGENESVDVRWVRMPVLLHDRIEGGCNDIDLSLVEITEDGAPVELRRIEKKRMATVHAILLDVSPSMRRRRRLEEATDAAGRYIESLPDGEPVIMATFDESLVLQGRLPEDAGFLADTMAQLEIGWGTMLWGSIEQMITYLSTRAERVVLVVISDGCDTQGLDGPRPFQIIEMAAHTENLTVFTIGIDLESECSQSIMPIDPGILLMQLARSTGGRFYPVRFARELGSILPEIRERLDREGYVVYEPLPFGSGPMDRPEQRNSCWRKVKIRVRGKTPCKVSLAGSSRRFEKAGRAFDGTASFRDNDDTAPPLVRDAGGEVLTGVVTDTVEDNGILYSPELYNRQGKFRFRDVFRSRTAVRSVQVPVPPFEKLIQENAGPAGVLLRAMRLSGEAADVVRWTEVPFLVNGRTFLDNRERLATALFSVPEYRDWAHRRIRDDRLKFIEELSGEARLDLLREHVRSLSWEPQPVELQRYLASWLGDVPAVDLVAAAETRLARMILSGEGTAGIEDRWPALHVWFPPPTEVRQLAMLVPGYSAERDVVGFYRVLLPRLRAWGPPHDLVPGEPFALRLVKWLLEQETVMPLFERGLHLETVQYDRPPRRELHKVRRWIRKTGMKPPGGEVLARSQVTIVFTAPDSPGAEVSIRAYYPQPGEGMPVCLIFPGDDDLTGLPGELLRRLARIIREGCPVRIE